MRLYTSGIKVPPLGSIEDRVIRKFMTKESERDTKKIQFMALLAVQSLPEKDDRVKKLWKEYLSLEYGVILPEHTEKEDAMIDFYANVVSKMKPQLTMNNGKVVVSGFEFLKKPPPPDYKK
jgi:hypothetical protein